MNLEKLHNEVMDKLVTFDVGTILPDLKHVAEGSLRDVLDKQNSLYYQYLACLIPVYRPKQIVELGGAMGTAALCMLSQMPSDARIYSITLEEGGQEFSFIKTEYPQLTMVVGDDLNLDSWKDTDIDFAKTDLVFIDSLHTYEQVKAELALYGPLFKKGTLMFFDDIHMDSQMFKMWAEIESPKLDVSVLHHSGFGMVSWEGK